ncbi:MAG: Fic family protein [bacterium]
MPPENNSFKNIPLELYKPDWDSALARTILELEKLRVKKLGGPVPPYIFFQLKNIFHMMESLGSARIEGNNTTLAEFVEKIIDRTSEEAGDDQLREILNIERAIDFIETVITDQMPLTRAHLSQIHHSIVNTLPPPPGGEGSRTPGVFRSMAVAIKKSGLVPPEPIQVPEYVRELLDFVNAPVDSQNDLLVTALAHHRLAWIHPFDNGNGRTVRLFTYALLIKQGFRVKVGRILNPTAIFCMDRERYYDMLARADSGTREGALEWCSYVLEGLQREVEKIDRLLDQAYLTENLLLPVLSYAREREHITAREYEILFAVVKSEEMSVKSVDLEAIIGQETPLQRSRIIKRLKDKGMLRPLKENGRIYTIGFVNNYLLRGIFETLTKNGFVPESLTRK